MGRLLFFIALGVLVYLLFKSWQRKQIETPPGKPRALPDESVHACRHCGTFSGLSNGVMLEGRFYCSLDHARAAGEKIGG